MIGLAGARGNRIEQYNAYPQVLLTKNNSKLNKEALNGNPSNL